MPNFLDEMTSHFTAAYGLTHQDASQSKSLLSHLWGDELPPHGDLDGQDDIDYALDLFMYDYAEHARRCDSSQSKVNTASEDEKKRKAQDTLARIKDMPLEIVHEILVHLQPLDLLSMSRSSHRLRDILMHKESRFIWKACLANVRGLPTCPPDISEPQFASLVFNSTCQSCGKDAVRDVFWTCAVRCCSNCISKQFFSEEELESQMPADVDIEKLASVFPYIVVDQYHPKQPSRALYYRPTATRYLSELKGALASKGVEGMDAWIKLKRENQIERIKHASLCEHWYNHWMIRSVPRSSELPLFDLAVTAVLSSALIYLWKDRIFG